MTYFRLSFALHFSVDVDVKEGATRVSIREELDRRDSEAAAEQGYPLLTNKQIVT